MHWGDRSPASWFRPAARVVCAALSAVALTVGVGCAASDGGEPPESEADTAASLLRNLPDGTIVSFDRVEDGAGTPLHTSTVSSGYVELPDGTQFTFESTRTAPADFGEFTPPMPVFDDDYVLLTFGRWARSVLPREAMVRSVRRVFGAEDEREPDAADERCLIPEVTGGEFLGVPAEELYIVETAVLDDVHARWLVRHDRDGSRWITVLERTAVDTAVRTVVEAALEKKRPVEKITAEDVFGVKVQRTWHQ